MHMSLHYDSGAEAGLTSGVQSRCMEGPSPISSFLGTLLGYSRYFRGRILDAVPERDTGASRSDACMRFMTNEGCYR